MEIYIEQITRLRQVLSRVDEGKPTPEDIELAEAGRLDLPVEVKLQALQIAALQNVAASAQNNHRQIALAMDFARHVTFYAMKIRPDAGFWATEINDDIEQQKFLFMRAQKDVEQIVRQQGQAVLPLVQQHKQLVDQFNMRNGRRVVGQTLYAETEKPGDFDPAQAREKLTALRAEQKQAALTDLQGLIDRSVLAIKRLHFVRTVIKPLFEKANDPGAASWDDDMAVSRATVSKTLNEAETVLTYHVARHSAFERRLNEAQPQ